VTTTRGTARVFFIRRRKKRLAPSRPAGLEQDVEHVSVLVDGPPQVLSARVDLDEHLVQVATCSLAGAPVTTQPVSRRPGRTSDTSAGLSSRRL